VQDVEGKRFRCLVVLEELAPAKMTPPSLTVGAVSFEILPERSRALCCVGVTAARLYHALCQGDNWSGFAVQDPKAN